MMFGRALRTTRYVRHMAARLGRRDAWVFEVAAMLARVQNLARSGTVAGVVRVLVESPRQLRKTA